MNLFQRIFAVLCLLVSSSATAAGMATCTGKFSDRSNQRVSYP